MPSNFLQNKGFAKLSAHLLCKRIVLIYYSFTQFIQFFIGKLIYGDVAMSSLIVLIATFNTYKVQFPHQDR